MRGQTKKMTLGLHDGKQHSADDNQAADTCKNADNINSYSKQHALYKAMKAFGQIIKSLFILRYLDELELRQAVEKQLNKVELAIQGNIRKLKRKDRKYPRAVIDSSRTLSFVGIICI